MARGRSMSSLPYLHFLVRIASCAARHTSPGGLHVSAAHSGGPGCFFDWSRAAGNRIFAFLVSTHGATLNIQICNLAPLRAIKLIE
jgi:hypothetical protein